MSDFPQGWSSEKLGDIADIRVSNVDKKTISSEVPVRLCNYMDVYSRDYINATDEFMSASATTSEVKRFALREGDVVITKDSESPDDIGIPALIETTSDDLVCGYHLAILRPSARLDSSWLAKQLGHERAKRYFAKVATGSTRYGLSNSSINNFEVWLPSVDEQRSAIQVLRTLDDAIQKTEQLINKLKQIKQGLLHDLLTRGIDENGQLRDPIAHPERFKDSVLGRIPVAWEVVQIKDIGKVFGGKRLPTGHSYSDEPTGYTYLRVLDFFEKTVDPKTLMFLPPETFAALERYEIHNGNLYISIAGSIGYVGVFEASDNVRTVLTENAARIDLTEDIYPPFVAYQMNGYEVQRQIDIEKGTGGGVPKLALFRIENLWIAKPPISEQKAIAQRLLQHEQTLGSEKKYLGKLKFLKKGLMYDLLTGKVRVKPNKEAV